MKRLSGGQRLASRGSERGSIVEYIGSRRVADDPPGQTREVRRCGPSGEHDRWVAAAAGERGGLPPTRKRRRLQRSGWQQFFQLSEGARVATLSRTGLGDSEGWSATPYSFEMTARYNTT